MYTSMERSASFWAGFADCTEEAIGFLLESENVSTNDPVIQGLREHLRQKQIELGLLEESNKNNNEVAVVVSSSNETDISVSESMETDMSIDRSDEGYNSSLNVISSDISSDISFSTEEIFCTTTHQQHVISSPELTNTNYFTVDQQTPHTAIIPTTPVHAHTVTVDSFSPIMHTQITSPISQHQYVVPPQHSFSTPVSNTQQQQQQSQVEFSDPFQDPVSLALLAQNNPEIASVAQELFQLLSEECADSLLCDEEDLDEDDDDDDNDADQIDDAQTVDEEVVCDNDNNETHDINTYSDCIILPVSSESQQSMSSISSNAVTSGQSSDDKENCQPEPVHRRVSPKLDNVSDDSNVQNTVLRLSPQNH